MLLGIMENLGIKMKVLLGINQLEGLRGVNKLIQMWRGRVGWIIKRIQNSKIVGQGQKHLVRVVGLVGEEGVEEAKGVEINLAGEDHRVRESLVGTVVREIVGLVMECQQGILLVGTMIKQVVGLNPKLLIGVKRMMVVRMLMHLMIIMDLDGTKDGEQVRRLVKAVTNGTIQNLLVVIGVHQKLQMMTSHLVGTISLLLMKELVVLGMMELVGTKEKVLVKIKTRGGPVKLMIWMETNHLDGVLWIPTECLETGPLTGIRRPLKIEKRVSIKIKGVAGTVEKLQIKVQQLDGVKVLVGKVDQMLEKTRMVEKVVGTQGQVMPIETRILVGVKKVIGMEVGTRALIGAKVIGTLDLAMQVKTKLRLLVIGEVLEVEAETGEVLEVGAVQIEEALEVEVVLEVEVETGEVLEVEVGAVQTEEALEVEVVLVVEVETGVVMVVEVEKGVVLVEVDQTEEDLEVEAVEGGIKVVVGTTVTMVQELGVAEMMVRELGTAEMTLVRIGPLTGTKGQERGGKTKMVQELGTVEVVIRTSHRVGMQEVVELAINLVVGTARGQVGTKEQVQIMQGVEIKLLMQERGGKTKMVQEPGTVEVVIRTSRIVGMQEVVELATNLVVGTKEQVQIMQGMEIKLLMQEVVEQLINLVDGIARVQVGTKEQVMGVRLSHLVGINQKMQVVLGFKICSCRLVLV